MKKIIYLLCFFVFIVIFIGCIPQDVATNTPVVSEVSTSSTIQITEVTSGIKLEATPSTLPEPPLLSSTVTPAASATPEPKASIVPTNLAM